MASESSAPAALLPELPDGDYVFGHTRSDPREYRATDTDSLQQIYRILDEMEPVAEPEAGFRPVSALYYWPLGGAFVLALVLAGGALLGTWQPRIAGVKAHAR